MELADEVAQLNWTQKIFNWAGEFQHAAKRAAIRVEARESGEDHSRGPRPSFNVIRPEQVEVPYDPEVSDREFYHPIQEFAQLYNVPVRHKGEWADPPVAHRIQMVRPVREGNRWGWALEEVRAKDGKALHDLSETQAYRQSRFLEATGEWGDIDDAKWKKIKEAYDPFAYGDYGDGQAGGGGGVMAAIDTEFIPIMGGPYYRQLYLYAHWEMLAKAFEIKNHSELARAAIMITSDFTIGRGVAWKISNDRVKGVWEEFWTRNRLDDKLRVWCDDLTWQGELLLRKDCPLKGFLRVRSMDPSVCMEIITEPTDIEQVYFYHCQFPTQYQLPYLTMRGQRMDVPLMRYVVEQLPPKEVYHVKLNVSSSEKRGRSDFYVSLGTVKRYRDWINAVTLRDMLQANLVWKVKLKGDDADTQAFVEDPNNSILPAAGGLWVENDALTLEGMHTDTTARGGNQAANTGAQLTALFATGQQMPVAYFNTNSQGAARATALVQGEPFSKKTATRQQVFKRLLDHLFEEVMELAVRAGRLTTEEIRGEDADPEWLFPAAYEEDRSAKFADLTTAKGLAAIAHKTMAIQMAKELQIDSYDYDQERQQIDDEVNDEFLALWPPAAGGTQAVVAPPAPTAPVPAVGASPMGMPAAGTPGAGGMKPGQPGQPQGMMPGMMMPAGPPPPPQKGVPARNVPGRMLQGKGAGGGGRGGFGQQGQPQQADLHQRIAGADARSRFRANFSNRAALKEVAPRLGRTDRRFLEAAVERGVTGAVRLPSGLIARIG